MSVLEAEVPAPESDEAVEQLELVEATESSEESEERQPVSLLTASAAAFLASAGVGWMLGGVFAGSAARYVAVLGALVGAGLVAASSRTRNPVVLQLVALPIAAVVGFVVTVVGSDGSSVVRLVLDAIQAGGLSRPPVPFDPGWRFLLVVITAGLAVAAATGAVALGRSRLAALLPAPLLVAGVLLQPPGREVSSVLPALVLLVAALAVSFGGELSRTAEAGASFEIRRLGKAGAFLLVIVGLMLGLSQVGFLFPPVEDSAVIPPKRPETPPPLTTNKVLYTIEAKEPVPLRLGVLDSYDGLAWLTPPYDANRYRPVTDSNLPPFAADRAAVGEGQPAPAKSVTIEVRVEEPGPAREIPTLAGTYAASGLPDGSEFDPRAGTLRLPGRADRGLSYTVSAVPQPSAAVLDKAKDPGPALAPFLQVPPPPDGVKALLSKLKPDLPAFERLQQARTLFGAKIIASGPGDPVDVPPSRVDELLNGTPASPYEITAAEVLLARWVGVPARIGYGYYDENAKPGKDGRIEIHEADGSMWLEAWFEGSGWTPVFGKPPKAQASLSEDQQKQSNTLPAGIIVAQLYIPVRQTSLMLFYTLVQFWLLRALAFGAGIFCVWILLPGLLKAARRFRRRRWALRHGPRARIAVAYAELRDLAIDFNVGYSTQTPLQFLDAIEPDDDATQLAWAVTRGLWGDLARDLREEDVETVEGWSGQLRRRFSAAQPYLMRMLAFGSRVSLRDPWSREMPNFYWKRSPYAVFRGLLRRGVAALWRRIRRLRYLQVRRLLPAMARASVVVVALSSLTGCVQQVDMSVDKAAIAPLPSVPAKVGEYTFKRTRIGDAQFEAIKDQALVADYRLYVIRQLGVAVGTLQTATFKPGLRSRNRTVREGVLTTLGGEPVVQKVGGEIVYFVTINQLRLLVWFAHDGLTYHLLAASKDLDDPELLLARIAAVEQGKKGDVTIQQGVPPVDVRRGEIQ